MRAGGNSKAAFPFARVLVVTQYYAPEPGAPQIRLGSVVQELRRMGIAVRVLTGMPNYPLGKIYEGYRGRLTMTESIEGAPVRRVWLFPAAGRGRLGRLLNYVSFTITAGVTMLFTRGIDVVFVEAQPISLALPAWFLRVVRGIPYIYNTPDLQVEVAEELQWMGGGAFLRLARLVEGFLMRHSLSIATVTHGFIAHFQKTYRLPEEKMSFLPNGADTELLRPHPRDQEYARILGVGSRKVFTYAGTHADYHGLEVIIEAAKRLQDREDILILMVGRGPVRKQLMEQARSAGLTNVVFRDSPFDAMRSLMSVTYASLVVLRDFPAARLMRLSKCIPPLACGVPVVYSGEGESADILDREGCGIKVVPGQPEALAGAIRRIADDPDWRDEMGKRGRDLAVRDFSWHSIVADWTRQIANIAVGGGPKIASSGSC